MLKRAVITLLLSGLSLACSESRPSFDPITMDPPGEQQPAPLLWEGRGEK